MAPTLDPVICPHCEAEITNYDDILKYTRLGGGMMAIACASCRKVLAILPNS